MSKKVRFLVALGALVLAIFLFCSCDNGSGVITPEDTSATSADVTSGDEPGETTVVVDSTAKEIKVVDGAVNYRVIRPDAADSTSVVVKAAQTIKAGIEEILGTSPVLDNDYVKRGEAHDSSTLEILVGLTTYDETAAVISECSYGDYIIKVVGNKIVVLGFSDICQTTAANSFVNTLKKYYDQATGVISFEAEDIETKVTKNDQLSALPTYEGATYSAYYDAGYRVEGQNVDEVIVTKASVDTHNAYLKKLEDNGYTKYTDNEINGNYFATYTNSKYTITTGYYAYETSERILIEPIAPKAGLASENKFTAVTTSQITMLGMEYVDSAGKTQNSNGLNILVRLTDGRFIIIDGGFNRADVANKIVSTIKAQSADYVKAGQKPVIAAWIITHSHGDHQGVLNSKYSTITAAAKVERLLVNFMSGGELTRARSAYSSNYSDTEGNGYTTSVANGVAMGADVFKVHVGQQFFFADLTIDVLYTIESFAPKACNALNTTSVVMKFTFKNDKGTTTYLSTGDATGNGMQICAKMYGDFMHTDIIQVCHHGYTTWGNDSGTISGYQKANSTLVLWPQGNRAFPNYKEKTYNAVLFKVSNFKECYVAGSQGDETIVKIPYTYGNGDVVCNYTNGRSTAPIVG